VDGHGFLAHGEQAATWATVLAMVEALLCLLGLLLLLVKEKKTTGWLEVRVRSGSLDYLEQILVHSEMEVAQLLVQVGEAESLAQRAGPVSVHAPGDAPSDVTPGPQVCAHCGHEFALPVSGMQIGGDRASFRNALLHRRVGCDECGIPTCFECSAAAPDQ
jgi:hypothetical protein